MPPTVEPLSSGAATPYILAGGSATRAFSIIGGVGTGQVFIDPTNGSTSYSFYTPGTYTPIVLGRRLAWRRRALQHRPVQGGRAIDDQPEHRPAERPRVGVAYSTALPVLNNEFGPVSYLVTAGALPTGFTLGAATGLVSGTGNVADAGLNFTFTITATDSVGRTATADYFIGVAANTGVITTTSIPTRFSTRVTRLRRFLQSNTPSPVFTNPGGGLPPGLTLSAAGVISGTPNTSGNYVFLVRLQDAAAGVNNTRQYTIDVSTAPSFTFSAPSPNEATVGVSTFIGINASGGRSPYTMSVSAGSLPDGLFIENFGSGVGISGTPMISGNQTFTILLTDYDGRTASANYTINVRQNVRITTLSADLPVATTGVPYSTTFTATLGSAPYTFSLSSGTLPAGLTLSPAGVLSGTPTDTVLESFRFSSPTPPDAAPKPSSSSTRTPPSPSATLSRCRTGRS